MNGFPPPPRQQQRNKAWAFRMLLFAMRLAKCQIMAVVVAAVCHGEQDKPTHYRGRTLHETSVLARDTTAGFRRLVDVTTFGAQGDGITDDTMAIQAAIDAASRERLSVFVPQGIYLTGHLKLKSNTSLVGEGRRTTLLLKQSQTAQIVAESASSEEFIENIYISDITLDGQVTTFRFSEHAHLLSLNGVFKATIERVRFIGFRGDGLYIGSGTKAAMERHNRQITVSECLFDGINRDNRNGITVIDCEGLVITQCRFTNCTRPEMPGALDIEPDVNSYHIIKDITIDSCNFTHIGGSVGALAVHIPCDTKIKPNNIKFLHNTFQYVSRAMSISSKAKYDPHLPIEPPGPTEGFTLHGNTVFNSIAGFGIFGVYSVSISNNAFTECTQTSYIGFINPPSTVRSVALHSNTFTRCGLKDGRAVTVLNAYHVDFIANSFIECGNGSADSSIIFFGNGTSKFVRIIGNSFLNSTRSAAYAIQMNSDHFQIPTSNTIKSNSTSKGLKIEGILDHSFDFSNLKLELRSGMKAEMGGKLSTQPITTAGQGQ